MSAKQYRNIGFFDFNRASIDVERKRTEERARRKQKNYPDKSSGDVRKGTEDHGNKNTDKQDPSGDGSERN